MSDMTERGNLDEIPFPKKGRTTACFSHVPGC